MRILVIVLALVLSSTVVMAQKTNKVKESKTGTYGAPISESLTPVALSDVIKTKSYGKTVQVTAKVIDVCSAAGCWMILKVRVSFKDYGFFVPSSLKSKTVVVEGVLTEVVTSEEDRRHYAEDAGATKEEIQAIKGEKRELAFEATGLEKK
jgi:hypothetical protein